MNMALEAVFGVQHRVPTETLPTDGNDQTTRQPLANPDLVNPVSQPHRLQKDPDRLFRDTGRIRLPHVGEKPGHHN